ncbi:hypothetical protein HYR69_08020 [Candidatus Sumerlaeota bacterium]|nr:hypothetical protein [Candidatus Sumerlaeota bacterium]
MTLTSHYRARLIFCLGLSICVIRSLTAQDANGLAELGPAPRLAHPELPPGETKPPGAAYALNSVPAINTSDRAAVAAAYYAYYVPAMPPNTPAAGWTGSIGSCTPGTTNQGYRDATLQMVNYCRAMVGLNSNITFDTTKNGICQEAALMMIAQKTLSHCSGAGQDCTGFACYTSNADLGASNSNLSLGRHGPASIMFGYMVDPGTGNEPAGHRRWILYPRQTFMATGDTTATNGVYQGSNALWVLGSFGSRPGSPATISWPPAGYCPYQLLPVPVSPSTGNQRWSFSVNLDPSAVNFTNATVSILRDGATPVTVSIISKANDDFYGDDTIVWEATTGLLFGSGQPDHTYAVSINNVTVNSVSTNYNYNVIVFDPPPPPTPTATPTASRTPTVSPSPTKSPSPTRSPSPTASPSPTPSATPSPSPSASPSPYNDAALVTHTIPASIPNSHNVPFIITMQNTGTLPWSDADGYRLNVNTDSCNLTTFSLLNIAPATTVNPGASYTFAGTLAGPASTGPCSLQFQMVDDAVPFGAVVTISPNVVTAVDSANVLSNTIPGTMPAEESLWVEITVRNNGNTYWIPGMGYGLTLNSDPCGFFSNPPIPVGETVAPNKNYGFLAYITAPQNDGSCSFTLQMRGPGNTPFGNTMQVNVNVQEPPNATHDWSIFE